LLKENLKFLTELTTLQSFFPFSFNSFGSKTNKALPDYSHIYGILTLLQTSTFTNPLLTSCVSYVFSLSEST